MVSIPLIYILSNGRSGSTLLDLILGSSPNAWTLGEAQMLPLDYIQNVQFCGCGAPIKDCEFWQTVCPEIPLLKGRYPIEYFRIPERKGKVLRWELLDDLRMGKVNQYHEAIEEYGKFNAQYLQAVLKEAQNRKGSTVKWLVDASKDPYRLFWLQQSGYFDIRVIHLTKHPNAFVYSMVKGQLPKATQKVIRMSGRWLIENAIFTRLCNASFSKNYHIHLRYEDLASQPDLTSQYLENWLDIQLPSLGSKTFRQSENHAISGNAIRGRIDEIKLDDKWKYSLPLQYQRLVSLITYSLTKKYKYPD